MRESIMRLLALLAVLAAWTPSIRVQAQSSSSKTPTSATSMTTKQSSPARSSTQSSSAASSTNTGIPPAVTHKIQVGLADHKFRPDTVRTAKGDTVEFSFFPQNHSVVRAEWGIPCIPYEMTGPGKAGNGFFSGFHPVDTVRDNPPTFSILINDTDPIFFYCSAPGSCTTYGMVGVINPNTSTFLDEQRNLALKADFALSPGEPFPAESSSSSTASPTASPSDPPSAHSPSSSHLAPGAIAGIVIACVGVVVLGALLFFFWGRFRGLRDELRRKDSTVVRTSSPCSPNVTSNLWNPVTSEMSQTSPAYSEAPPMSSHAKPDSYPPAYFPAPIPTPMSELAGHEFEAPLTTAPMTTTTRAEDRLSRTISHRSSGGTFDLSPKGYYMRTHDGPHTSDMTSPTDPSLVPVGPYGRQMRDLQRAAGRSNSITDTPERGYFESAYRRPSAHAAPWHMTQQSPVEIEDTSTAATINSHVVDKHGGTPLDRGM